MKTMYEDIHTQRNRCDTGKKVIIDKRHVDIDRAEEKSKIGA